MAVAKKNKKAEDNLAWDAFVAWCQERGVSAVPANPWTLAAYARWCEHQQSCEDITKTFKAIFRIHGAKSRKRPDRDPLVLTTLSQIEERLKEKKATEKRKAKDKTPPLFPDDDILDPSPPAKSKKKKNAKKATPLKGKGKDKGKTKAKAGGKKTRPGLSAGPRLVSKRKLKN
ncbi:MAG: hypothetical protein O3A85_03775 [Proteobacteria bacterium]|nr:hypothetical protein [Pseudomonadota bacterium]